MSKLPAGLYVNVERDPSDRDTWRADVRVRMDDDGAGFAVRGVADAPEDALEQASDRATDVIESEPGAAARTDPRTRDALAAIKVVCHVVRNDNGAVMRDRVALEPRWRDLVRKLEGCSAGKSSTIGGPLCLCHHGDDARAVMGAGLFDFIGQALSAATNAINSSPILKAVASTMPGGSVALAAMKAATDAKDAGASDKDTKKALEKHLDDHPDGKKIAKDATDTAKGDKDTIKKNLERCQKALSALMEGAGGSWGGWGDYADAMSPENTDRFWGDWLAEQMRAFRDGSQGELAGAGAKLKRGGSPQTVTVHPTQAWQQQQAQQQQLDDLTQQLQAMQQQAYGAPYGAPPYDPSGGYGYDPSGGYGGGWPAPAPYGYGYQQPGGYPMMGQGYGYGVPDSYPPAADPWSPEGIAQEQAQYHDALEQNQEDYAASQAAAFAARDAQYAQDYGAQPAYAPSPWGAPPWMPPPGYPPYGAPPYGAPPPWMGPSGDPGAQQPAPQRTPHATVTQTGPSATIKRKK